MHGSATVRAEIVEMVHDEPFINVEIVRDGREKGFHVVANES